MQVCSKVRGSSVIADVANPVDESYDGLLDCIGDAEVVLIGEASHGTHEFYSIRERLTRRLVAEKGFRIVALEADWPDALRVNHYVRGCGEDRSADSALEGFRRFPTWMWRNTVMVEFVEWMRGWNSGLEEDEMAGVFGMDLYSLHSSIEAVIDYLYKVDPEAAKRACERYSCFDHFGSDPQQYGYLASSGAYESCEDEVVSELMELRKWRIELVRRDRVVADDAFFFAEQNARLVVNAERYYRSMYRGDHSSWNLRDEHMADTLVALREYFGGGDGKVAGGGVGKMVVWAHNSHLGDARATEMGKRGEWNVGQLMRERFGARVFNIGFSTYEGTVTAASNWGGQAERRWIRPGLRGSYEELFHETGLAGFWLDLREGGAAADVLAQAHLQRAIGVIYRPETERLSHYFSTSLPKQFDAMIHIDETRALEPLERFSEWEEGELPETFPSGL